MTLVQSFVQVICVSTDMVSYVANTLYRINVYHILFEAEGLIVVL